MRWYQGYSSVLQRYTDLTQFLMLSLWTLYLGLNLFYCRSNADPIWLDGTLEFKILRFKILLAFVGQANVKGKRTLIDFLNVMILVCFCVFLVYSLFSFHEFQSHFLFPSVPSVSSSTPSPVLILLRCLRSVIILSSVFSLPLSSHSLSDPQCHSCRHSHRLPHGMLVLEFSCFLPSFVEFCFVEVCSFSPALLRFWVFLLNKPFKLLLAPIRVCIWVLLPRLQRNRDSNNAIVVDEMAIEVSETKESFNCLRFAGVGH